MEEVPFNEPTPNKAPPTHDYERLWITLGYFPPPADQERNRRFMMIPHPAREIEEDKAHKSLLKRLETCMFKSKRAIVRSQKSRSGKRLGYKSGL